MATDGITPLRNIYTYSQILDPILNSKNMYVEVSVQVTEKSDTDLLYKSDVYIVFGELLRQDKIPRNGYGCKIRNGFSNNDSYDLYTLQFNNDYGGQGINSISIPYNSYQTGTSLFCATMVLGIGWNYETKQLFFHANPNQYGDEYGLSIPVTSFPENTRLYIITVDVDKTDDSFTNQPVQVSVDSIYDYLAYKSVADKYLNEGGVTTDWKVTVTANRLSKQFGQPDPLLTYTYTLYPGTDAYDLQQTPGFTGTLSREPGEEVGTRNITQGTLALADNDGFIASKYTLEFVPNILTITPAPIVTDPIMPSGITPNILATSDFSASGVSYLPPGKYNARWIDDTYTNFSTVREDSVNMHCNLSTFMTMDIFSNNLYTYFEIILTSGKYWDSTQYIPYQSTLFILISNDIGNTTGKVPSTSYGFRIDFNINPYTKERSDNKCYLSTATTNNDFGDLSDNEYKEFDLTSDKITFGVLLSGTDSIMYIADVNNRYVPTHTKSISYEYTTSSQFISICAVDYLQIQSGMQSAYSLKTSIKTVTQYPF